MLSVSKNLHLTNYIHLFLHNFIAFKNLFICLF